MGDGNPTADHYPSCAAKASTRLPRATSVITADYKLSDDDCPERPSIDSVPNMRVSFGVKAYNLTPS